MQANLSPEYWNGRDYVVTEKILINIKDLEDYISSLIYQGYNVTEKGIDLKTLNKYTKSNILENTELIKKLLSFIKEVKCGMHSNRISPILIGNNVYYSVLHISFIVVGERVLLSSRIISNYYFKFKKNRVMSVDFSFVTKFWPESTPAENISMTNHGENINNVIKSNFENLKELFKEHAWVDNSILVELSKAIHFQVMECKNSFILLCSKPFNPTLVESKYSYRTSMDYEANTPYMMFTPYGTYECTRASMWTSQNVSVRDFFLKTLGDKWKFMLRSKKNNDLFGKSIKELDWTDQDFLNTFTSAALIGARNIS